MLKMSTRVGVRDALQSIPTTINKLALTSNIKAVGEKHVEKVVSGKGKGECSKSFSKRKQRGIRCCNDTPVNPQKSV